jgi:pyrrolidone-carboxylate peptidase
MYSFQFITNQVQKNIQKYGQPVKVVNTAGVSISTHGVFGKIEHTDLNNAETGHITIQTYVLYVAYIKNQPEVGGTVIINKVEYGINKVEIYQPNNTAIAYKLELVLA